MLDEEKQGEGLALLHRPLYLITNMSGREYPRWANHFDPYSPIYSRRERSEILISDCALGLAFSGLYSLAQTFGWLWLAKVSRCSEGSGTEAQALHDAGSQI